MSDLRLYDDFISWYEQNESTFSEYAEYVCSQVKALLSEYHIFPAYTTSRAKNVDSLRKKCKRIIEDPDTGNAIYKYSDPKNQITDMAGARIVTYTVSDLAIVSLVVKKLFEIDVENSSDKKQLLSTDKVGYLSIHYVVSPKPSDLNYEKFKIFKCEIQIRTVLQDAWAQIFHDRQYKPLEKQPPSQDMLRETHLLAATLELLDDEIDLLAQRYDNFYRVPNNKEFQLFLDEKITEKNLAKYIHIIFGKSYRYYDFEFLKKILSFFAIDTIRDFDKICDSQLILLLKSKARLTADHIIYYMVIARYPQDFFENFHEMVHVTQDTVEGLSEFVDMSLYLQFNKLEEQYE